jgi:hypothetical protein
LGFWGNAALIAGGIIVGVAVTALAAAFLPVTLLGAAAALFIGGAAAGAFDYVAGGLARGEELNWRKGLGATLLGGVLGVAIPGAFKALAWTARAACRATMAIGRAAIRGGRAIGSRFGRIVGKGLDHIDNLVQPGSSNRVSYRVLKNFEEAVNKLGYKVKRRGKNWLTQEGRPLQATTNPAEKVVYVNRRIVTQKALIDEYAHIWNNVMGRGQHLDEMLGPMHTHLGNEALRKGTANLLPSDNLLFHRLELKNLLESGTKLPDFFEGVTEQMIRAFTG